MSGVGARLAAMAVPRWRLRAVLVVGVLVAAAMGVTLRAAEPPGVVRLPPIDELPPPVERLPPTEPLGEELPNGSPFPGLPPAPGADALEPLPPLDEELWLHGGSYLYTPEGDRLNWPEHSEHEHFQVLRLPETWQEPRPLTFFQEFLGADPIRPSPALHWFGHDGFQAEPRFVGYGSYELFGFAFEEGDQRRDALGHQLLVDLDLRLTGTERAHVQFRPLGRENTGGSFFQLNDPRGYEDNSTLIPDRWWIEGELYSMFGSYLDPFLPRDVHLVVGKFPFALHNSLLINDDITGVAVNKNTILIPPLSNLNVQLFYAFDSVDAFADASSDVFGINGFADYEHAFIELTYARLLHSRDSGRHANYAALSATQFFGLVSLTGRALFKEGDPGGTGDGQLFVIESNYHRVFSDSLRCATGFEHGLFYGNAFRATSGWSSISGGNFNRLRTAFEVDPLVAIAAGRSLADTSGTAWGVQLFRRHDDASLTPEFAFEAPDGDAVWGFGLRYLHKLGPRTFLEALGVRNWSDVEALRREGIFVSTTFLL